MLEEIQRIQNFGFVRLRELLLRGAGTFRLAEVRGAEITTSAPRPRVPSCTVTCCRSSMAAAYHCLDPFVRTANRRSICLSFGWFPSRFGVPPPFSTVPLERLFDGNGVLLSPPVRSDCEPPTDSFTSGRIVLLSLLWVCASSAQNCSK